MSFQNITALILAGIFVAIPSQAWAGSCCGGGGGSTLIVPKAGRAAVSLNTAIEKYDGYYDKQSSWHADPPGSDLAQYRVELGIAQRLGTDWQGSVSLPYVWNNNSYAAVDSSTNGLGDMTLGVTYETFKAPTCVTRISRLQDLKPTVYLGGGLLIPTGVSPYDEVENSFDITGRGFYRADLNLMVEKTVFPWSVILSGGVGYHFSREINREYGTYVQPYSKQLGRTVNGSLALGYTWDLPWQMTSGMTLIVTASLSDRWEAEAEIDGVRDEASGLRKRAVGLSSTLLSFGNDWALNLGWQTSRPASGWGSNTPATDVFSLGVRHDFY
ncbi:MAG: transporter [Proteobacteria bacterium]|nr:transporter [Pseudomonadota bacterium]